MNQVQNCIFKLVRKQVEMEIQGPEVCENETVIHLNLRFSISYLLKNYTLKYLVSERPICVKQNIL